MYLPVPIYDIIWHDIIVRLETLRLKAFQPGHCQPRSVLSWPSKLWGHCMGRPKKKKKNHLDRHFRSDRMEWACLWKPAGKKPGQHQEVTSSNCQRLWRRRNAGADPSTFPASICAVLLLTRHPFPRDCCWTCTWPLLILMSLFPPLLCVWELLHLKA